MIEKGVHWKWIGREGHVVGWPTVRLLECWADPALAAALKPQNRRIFTSQLCHSLDQHVCPCSLFAAQAKSHCSWSCAGDGSGCRVVGA